MADIISFGNLSYRLIPCSILLVSAVLLCRKIYNKSKQNFALKKIQFEDSEGLNDVLFFTHTSGNCKCRNNDTKCDTEYCSYSNVRRLIECIDSAEISLDVCEYMITCSALANAVIRRFRAGVKVRVITDNGVSFNRGSTIPYFRKIAIPVRIKVSDHIMHHKFVIVDRKLVLTGSMNWTNQALFGNWESSVIFSAPRNTEIVEKHCYHFDYLWNEFSYNQ